MKILLIGTGSASFSAALDEAGIRYVRSHPRPAPGVIWNAGGDVLQFVDHAVPSTSLATVMVAWIRAKSSRKIIVTTKDRKVLHTEGYSVDQFERLLERTSELAAIDISKPAS